MKILIILAFFINIAWAQCSSISRTNASGTLTSTKYNGDLNTVYNFANSYDGGCIQDNSIQKGALNSSDFDPFLNTGKQGCKLNYVDTNTVGIDACKIGVDGNLISTISQTNVTWNCAGCSAEATATYYVYAQSAATLSLVMTTTAPNAAGYNGVNRVLGKFLNNTSLDIDSSSVASWNGLDFGSGNYLGFSGTDSLYYAIISNNGTVSGENTDWINGNCGNLSSNNCTFTTTFTTAPKCWVQAVMDGLNPNGYCFINNGYPSTSTVNFSCLDHTGGTDATYFHKTLFCIGK